MISHWDCFLGFCEQNCRPERTAGTRIHPVKGVLVQAEKIQSIPARVMSCQWKRTADSDTTLRTDSQ